MPTTIRPAPVGAPGDTRAEPGPVPSRYSASAAADLPSAGLSAVGRTTTTGDPAERRKSCWGRCAADGDAQRSERGAHHDVGRAPRLDDHEPLGGVEALRE